MRVAPVLLIGALAAPLPLWADEQPVACDSSCPEGKVMVSFADGNNATCVCQEPAAMDPTLPDPNAEGGSDAGLPSEDEGGGEGGE